MGKIILARPGQTELDEQERIVGNLDLPVSVRGLAELEDLARAVAGCDIEIVYGADGEASRQSARFLGDRLGVPVQILDDLRNLDFGLWQGLEKSEVRRKHPKLYRQLEESPCAACPPAGEMIDELQLRVARTTKTVLKRARKGA
ncbi:MAG: histidine phosphatase family protein, partial [Planctomycetia bacterium]